MNVTRLSQDNNPYSDLNVSQIEYTATKRDYSPIITTSKHDLRRIYDPSHQQMYKSQNFKRSKSHMITRSVDNTKKENSKQFFSKTSQTKADL